MKLPIEHCRTTTTSSKDDFDTFGSRNIFMDCSPQNVWADEWRKLTLPQDVQEDAIDDVFAQLDAVNKKQEAVTEVKYTVCDGNKLLEKSMYLLNPKGTFEDQTGSGIKYSGYPIRKEKPAKTHG